MQRISPDTGSQPHSSKLSNHTKPSLLPCTQRFGKFCFMWNSATCTEAIFTVILNNYPSPDIPASRQTIPNVPPAPCDIGDLSGKTAVTFVISSSKAPLRRALAAVSMGVWFEFMSIDRFLWLPCVPKLRYWQSFAESWTNEHDFCPDIISPYGL
ncbi:hypothetical protein K504DRAFT_533398 [Pleomassaria siparia CBS 279.74]|uniref:Uncharacterized protein n=1 Tax=Pleomassaria siparia CBS 279.74 TaxID=1314801 RepID=A0A6G1KDD7_9PLEO|nr:hypothetical protein K504DRAFT_533398 [Pleomassaria siparia CBS 279.74]